MQSRTHTCGQLRLENAGEKVTLCGWMENVRVVGQNFAFVVLRDFYGTTQLVVETEEMMNIIKSINKESTINVTGVAVAAREGAPIGWKRYCKYALPASVLVLLLSMTMILLMH